MITKHMRTEFQRGPSRGAGLLPKTDARLRRGIRFLLAAVLVTSGVIAVAPSASAVPTDGAGYGWGLNTDGKLGNGTTDTPALLANPMAAPPGEGLLAFTKVTAGRKFACGLTAAGVAYCWGGNVNGELGSNVGISSLLPVPVNGGLSFTAISSGFNHTCALTPAGRAYCWGRNSAGQLGDGLTASSSVPVAVVGPLSGAPLTFRSLSAGSGHTCAITNAGAMYCWGYNPDGRLGDGTIADSLVPIAVLGPALSAPLEFSTVSAGSRSTCGITTAGATYCWGDNTYGQLGDGSTNASLRPIAVVAPQGGSLLSFASLSAANAFTCGITTSATAYCWGNNTYGGLGNGTTTHSDRPVPVSGGIRFAQVSGGTQATCGIDLSGGAYCWGSNQYGKLGDGTTTSRSVPGPVLNPNGTGQLVLASVALGESFAIGIAPLSSGGDVPPDVLQQVGLLPGGSCSSVADALLNWGGASSGSWGQSWAQWPNEGRGGPVCTRTLAYSNIFGHWFSR
jgi:alpha-tubulin suppressor-like RCC1 family protein